MQPNRPNPSPSKPGQLKPGQTQATQASPAPAKPPVARTITSVPQSDTSQLKLTKWIIMLILAVTSLPAGLIACSLIDLYRTRNYYASVAEGGGRPGVIMQARAKVDSLGTDMMMAGLFFAITFGMHLFISITSMKAKDKLFIGLRGSVWVALTWSVFGLGVVGGVWIFLSKMHY